MGTDIFFGCRKEKYHESAHGQATAEPLSPLDQFIMKYNLWFAGLCFSVEAAGEHEPRLTQLEFSKPKQCLATEGTQTLNELTDGSVHSVHKLYFQAF